MKGSSILLIIGVGFVPLAIFSLLILGPTMVQWQPDILWQTQFGTPGDLVSNAVTSVAAGDNAVIVTGYVGSAVGQNPTPSYTFLKKYSLDGTEVWTRQLGKPENISAVDLVVGTDGLYVAGFNGSTAFLQKEDSTATLSGPTRCSPP